MASRQGYRLAEKWIVKIEKQELVLIFLILKLFANEISFIIDIDYTFF
ncbi:hypothetical protein [Arsenophonus nasoniae]